MSRYTFVSLFLSLCVLLLKHRVQEERRRTALAPAACVSAHVTFLKIRFDAIRGEDVPSWTEIFPSFLCLRSCVVLTVTPLSLSLCLSKRSRRSACASCLQSLAAPWHHSFRLFSPRNSLPFSSSSLLSPPSLPPCLPFYFTSSAPLQLLPSKSPARMGGKERRQEEERRRDQRSNEEKDGDGRRDGETT